MNSRSEQGFVLAVTLWFLVVLTIAASYFAERLTQARQLAQQAQASWQAQLDFSSTRAEILFRLATTPLTIYGLGPDYPHGIMLDNRPYQGVNDSLVRLQDNRGLLNLNVAEDDAVLRLLGMLEVPADMRGRMIDTLRDYMDEDNLKRLNGAEADEYRALNLPPPRNAKLLTPFEPQHIIGWRDVPRLWENDRLPSLVAVGPSMAVNPNTAPIEVLATLPGVTKEIAQAIITRRQLAPFSNVAQITAMTGVPLQELFALKAVVVPSNATRVTHSSPHVPWALQYNVTLTPGSDQAPWRIDYYYKSRVIYPDDNIVKAPALPPRSTLAPALATPVF